MSHTLLFRRLLLALQRARREHLQAEGKPAPVAKEQVGWSRRRLLKTVALAGATGVVSSVWPFPVRAATSLGANARVAIVGGGLAGLNAAYQLKKAGIRATVYEALPRVGGRIFSTSGTIGEGVVTDLGAELINSDHEEMLQLVEDFNLELFDRIKDAQRFPFPETGYFFDGTARDEAEVATDLLPLAAQIASDSERLDADFPSVARELDQLSVKDYLDRHAGVIHKAYIRTLIENSIRTEYGVEPKNSSALQLIFNLPTVDGQAVEVLGNSDEVFVVKGGTSKIIEGLTRQLDGQIQMRMELLRLNAQEETFRLHFASGETVVADMVLLTIPFPVLRRVKLDVPLPDQLRQFIHKGSLGRNEKVIAGFRTRAWRHPQGFAVAAWTDLGYAEVWDATQRQPERTDGALTYYLGGREVAVLEKGGARSVGRTFVQRLEKLIPGVAAASTDTFLRTNWGKSRFSRGAYANFKPGQLTQFGGFQWIDAEDATERQEVHVWNLVFAGEHLSNAFYGFMNGAAETGRLAADFVVRRLTTGS